VAFELQVRSAATGAPVPKTLLVIAFGDGERTVGGITTAEGLFDLHLPSGTPTITVRTFAGGFRSKATGIDLARPDLTAEAGVARWIVEMTPLAASEVALAPRSTGFAASPAQVPARDAFTFSAAVVAGSAADPLSTDVLLVDPNHHGVAPLTPGPDGTYATAGLNAPSDPGTFGYYLVTRTQGNVAGDIPSAVVDVRSKEPSVHMKVSVADASGAPVQGALLAIQIGGDLPFADTSRPSPYFQLGGVTATDGTADLLVPKEALQVHALARGYAEAASTADPPAGITITAKALAPDQLLSKPIVSAFTASPTILAAGSPLDVAAQIARGPGGDPVSDKILVVEATTGWSGELAPPSPGRLGQGYPEGLYTRRVAAPVAAGTYTYRLVAVSQGGIPSDPQTVQITVQ
jgi:hypothetical protein